MPKIRLALHWQILIALALAVVAGALSGPETTVLGLRLFDVYDFLGTLFLRALRMLVVPLVAAAVITAILGMGKAPGFARLGGKTALYFSVSGLGAILIGLVLVNFFQPGIVNGTPAKDLIGLSANTDAVISQVGERTGADVVGVLVRMIPSNIVEAAAQTDMLALIFFCILFGFFAARIEPKAAQAQQTFWQSTYETMLGITDLVMRFAPLGVFGLVAKTFATSGLSAVRPLLGFFFTVLGALALHMFLLLPLLLLAFRINPKKHFQAMGDALLMAFSTSSSSATLPRTLECLERRAGVPRRIGGFVAPLGSTVNMDGTALYECVAALFIAQAYGIQLGFAAQFTVVLLALLTSVGVAGIPSASLVAITIILAAVGLPLEGIGLILAVDRLLDMCRTSVNVFSDSCGAAIIARSEARAPDLPTRPIESKGIVNRTATTG